MLSRKIVFMLSMRFALLAVVVPCAWASAAATPIPLEARCTTLAARDFSPIQDAPAWIVKTRLVAATAGDPPYCRVQGYVWPQVGFDLRLPLSTWNGRFMEIGCGGECGDFFWTAWCPLRRGYACIVSDLCANLVGMGLGPLAAGVLSARFSRILDNSHCAMRCSCSARGTSGRPGTLGERVRRCGGIWGACAKQTPV
ncbi:MAG TPA: hypothetical protein VGR92_19540 [Steroidobacteraceae bacterium]|nr:hypothetical protein [Steroidobacteraceae bacterium]